MRVDGDDRAVVLHVGDRRRHEHGAVDEGAHHPREVAPLPADVVVDPAAGGVGDQLVAGAADRVGRALEHLGAERLEVGDQHADHVGPGVAQAARDQAGLVAEPVDHLGDVLGGLAGDAVPAVDDLRDGRHGHAGLGGDLLHRHPAARSPGARHLESLAPHPLTAPWSPLTIRRCIARNSTSAGIIAIVVKASTPAVSAECSVE